MVRRVTASAPAGAASQLGGQPGPSQAPKRRAATLDDLNLLARHLAELVEVPEDVCQDILAGAMVLEAKAGDVFLRQGETDTEAFFVLKGRVVVKREEEDVVLRAAEARRTVWRYSPLLPELRARAPPLPGNFSRF